MRKSRGVFAGVVLAVVMLTASACFPPSQAPIDQPLPAGGRVVATGPALEVMSIEDASADLSTIAYGRQPLEVPGVPAPQSFWVYDDHTQATVPVLAGQTTLAAVTVAPDARSLVFASNDASLQVGPTSVNCEYGQGPLSAATPTMCTELYLFDLQTRATRQLTGLGGSSTYGHYNPKFTADGTAVDFLAMGGAGSQPIQALRLDIATGVVSDTPAAACCSWDRGTHHIAWDPSTGTLTSTDATTGQVTTLWASADVYGLERVIGGGRLIVLSWWVNGSSEIFRLIDTDTGTVRDVPSPWVSQDGGTYAVVQQNVAPDGTDRLVIAPLPQ